MVGPRKVNGKALFVALFLASNSFAQVTFVQTYAAGSGFDDNTIDSGETLTRGQLRQNTINAVTTYMQTVFDGRGKVEMTWNPWASGSALASMGPSGYAGILGSFQNGQAYVDLRTGLKPFSTSPDAAGRFNFASYGFNYVGANTNNGSKYDMFTVALHEMSHGMGFISGFRTNASNQFLGQGLLLSTPGTPDLYGTFDKYLQRGNGVGGQLMNVDLSSTGYGSFSAGDLSTFTNGNNPANGLFFGGKYAQEVYSAPVPLYAPGSYAQGTSISHDNTSPEGVMHPSIGTGVTRQAYKDYEIAMLLDIGYNVYNWNASTTSSWSGGDVNNMAVTPWRTDLGIAFVAGQQYNTHNNPGQAPILAPYAQVTSNIILNFSGTAAYNSTNDLGTMRMCRINLDSTAGSASTITGGTFLFGQNSDGSFSALVPKIVQQNTGAFNFGSTIQIADPVRGLVVDGPGSGTLTFNGNLAGVGGLTKAGSFLMVMNGAANSYAGVTTINQGTLRVNGAKTGAGAVTINNTGRLGGNGSIAGAVSVNTGGFIAPGSSAGNLTVSGGLTMNAGTYDWELASLTTSGAGSNFDLITLAGGASSLGGSSSVQLNFGLLGIGLDPNGSNAFWLAGHQWQIVSVSSGTLSGVFGGISNSNWSSGVFSLFGNGSGVFLNFSPVPEPSTMVLLILVSGGWLALRRKLKSL